jgi:hypothetical protein
VLSAAEPAALQQLPKHALQHSSSAASSGVSSAAEPAALQLPQYTLQHSYAAAPAGGGCLVSTAPVLGSSSMVQHGSMAPAVTFGSTYGMQASTGLLQGCSSTSGAFGLPAVPCTVSSGASALSRSREIMDIAELLLQDDAAMPSHCITVQQAGLMQVSTGLQQLGAANAGAYNPQFSLVNAGAAFPAQLSMGQASTAPTQFTYTQAPMLCGAPAGSGVFAAAAAPMGLQVAPSMQYSVVQVAPVVSCTPVSSCSVPGIMTGFAGQHMVQQAPVQQFAGSCSAGGVPAIWINSPNGPVLVSASF